jgi:hypothetical protein
MYRKLSLEREVDQMVNDMIQKEGWTRSYALSILRSKFESEERYQEVSYVDDLIRKEAGEQEKEQEFEPTATTTTTTTNTVAEQVITTREPEVTTSSRKPSKVTRPLQQKELHETISSKSISKQLDKQTIQINKKITQIIQSLQKHIRSVDKQSQLIRQLQSQLKPLQKQVSQIQRVVGMGKKKQKR